MKRFIAALFFLVLSAPLFGNEKEGGIIGTGVVGRITSLDEFEVSGMRFNLPADINIKGIESQNDLPCGNDPCDGSSTRRECLAGHTDQKDAHTDWPKDRPKRSYGSPHCG